MASVAEPDADGFGGLENCAFAVALPEPPHEAEWTAIVQDPSRFVAKKVAKGVEVSWQKLSPTQRAALAEAKNLEINEWVSREVCRAAMGPEPLREDEMGVELQRDRQA